LPVGFPEEGDRSEVARPNGSDDGSYADGNTDTGTFKARFEDGFAFGAGLGFDAFLGKCWGFTGGVEYFKVETEADRLEEDFLEVDVDPLIVKAGFVYHF
jgi:outer membrane protein W